MIRFDWRGFCSEHSVPFVTSGPNTARGHISIQCPWCGDSDRSHHMGLSLEKSDPRWGCFRNAGHRGRSPRRLVQRLLGVSFKEAWRIVELQQEPVPEEGELARAMQALQSEEPERSRRETVLRDFPAEFKPIIPGRGYANRFLDYLAGERGFGERTFEVCERFGLHYAVTGDYAWRVIFPICEEDGRLAGFTGRDIRPKAWLRYHSSEALPHRLLYNSHLAARSLGDTLVIVEGPVDAAKVDFFGASLGVTAVATLGTALPRERRASLAQFCRRFERVALLFDEETLSEVVGLLPELSETSGSKVALWRPGAKDPGAMSEGQLVEFLQNQMGEA